MPQKARSFLTQEKSILYLKMIHLFGVILMTLTPQYEIASNAVAMFAKKLEAPSTGNETKFKKILKRHLSAGSRN